MSKTYKLTLLLLLIVSSFTFAQKTYKVSGVVTSKQTGEPLIGANVFVSELNTGSATDFEGKYEITLPSGKYKLNISYIGFETRTVDLSVTQNTQFNIALEPTDVTLKGVVVAVNRAKERETPVTFTEIGSDVLAKEYTTQDVPDLLKNVPGVFTSSSGLGESQIYIRGFDAEHIQILINGVPVNDPESQVVYWSNWTGLAGNASSVQVQRGVGASLVGSGAFGGSVNIKTSQYSRVQQLKFRASTGFYTTQGVKGGILDGKNAIGTGGYQNYSPANENLSFSYTSGQLYDGLLNINFQYERKSGDSYLEGTSYNGHSFYLGLQSLLSGKSGEHLLTFNFIGSPQRHHQARTMQDIDLIPTLGREYNRFNHPYQENYYFKPQFELHHDWVINKKQNLSTNAFYTFGTGGGRYLRNDFFNVNNGEVGFKKVDAATDLKYFGRHARFIYEKTGVVLTGFNPNNNTFIYNGDTSNVSKGRMLISSSYAHSWRNDSQNHHKQFGLNTAYTNKLSNLLSIAIGGEIRHWRAQHTAQSFDFRMMDPVTGSVKELREVQRRYNYDGIVKNYSGFARLLVTPITDLTIMLDGQYAISDQSIEENPMEIYDFAAQKFTGKTYFGTKTGNNFADDDYHRKFSFFMPKFGVNYNVSNALNVFANYSISKKEPKTGDWYDRERGPGQNELSGKVKEETLKNIEVGLGYRASFFTLNANYYILDFQDKIERITNEAGNRETMNAGNAKHKGFELSGMARYQKFDANASISVSTNTWQEMNVEKIFGVDSKDVVGKVVPFSPENIYHAGIGYSFTHNFRFGLSADMWSNYYGNYTNSVKLPDFFELNAVVSYSFKLGNSNIDLRLNANNLTNNDNYQRAAWAKDYNRNDNLAGKYHMYVVQSPLRNFFFTTSVSL